MLGRTTRSLGGLLAAILPSSCCCLGLGQGVRTGPPIEDQLAVEAGIARRAEVEVAFGPGDLVLRPAPAQAEVLKLRSRTNVERFRPLSRTELDGNVLVTSVRSESHDGGLRFWNWDQIENRWEMELAPSLPMDLELAIGGGTADVDLGGLNLRSLDVEVGTGNYEIRFDRPNATEMQSLALEAGACHLEVERLGDAGFSKATAKLGTGHFVLDLSGEWRRDAQLEVDAGVADLELWIPRDLKVRIELRDRDFAHVDCAAALEQEGEVFTSAAWREANADRASVEVFVDVSLGSLTLLDAEESLRAGG